MTWGKAFNPPSGGLTPQPGKALPPADRLPEEDRLEPEIRLPRRSRLVILGALALASLLAVLVLVAIIGDDDGEPAEDLDQALLAGPRLVHGRVCLDVAVDMSGSMREEQPIRDEAVEKLSRFLKANRSEDYLASAVFADKSQLMLKPTRMNGLPAGGLASVSPPDGRYTYLSPALQLLETAYRKIPCAAHALIVVTDAEIADPSADLERRFKALELLRCYFALPKRPDDARPSITADLPTVRTRGFRDSKQLALLYGRTLAELTGQRLVKAP